MGDIVDFLKIKGFWDDTFLILASDRGYHVACIVAHKMGLRPRIGAATIRRHRTAKCGT